jgi:hypothetical protein
MLGTGPEVVIDDKIPLTKKDIEASGGDVLLVRRTVTYADIVRRRRALRCAMIVIAFIMILIISAASTMLILRHLRNRPFEFVCGTVAFHEMEMENNKPVVHKGTFEERVELDNANGVYERLDVPPILDSRGSTVVHDFERNLTAIVDKDHGRCFVFPLNRAYVQPPENLLDLIQKFKSGYYLPDAEVVRETYKVITPAVDNIEQFGYYIWYDCQFFDTYRLVKDTDPIGEMSRKKRSASACLGMAGNKFCLGGLGDHLRCVTLSGCE